jgi:regulator of protease activity HflC (stomatin/prohibitin superfamily)
MGVANVRSGYESPEQAFRRLAPRVAKIVGAVILGLVLVFGSFYSVGQGHMGVVTRFGAVTRVTGPGGHFKLPLFEDVEEIGTRTQTLEWAHTQQGDGRMKSYSKDQQPADIGVKVSFNVKPDEKSVRALFAQYKNSDGYANAVIVPRAMQGVKTVFGRFSAEGVIQDRDGFNKQITQELASLIGNDGPVVIEQINIQDIDFDDSYEAAGRG